MPNSTSKQLCGHCKKEIAVWYYMPSYEGKIQEKSYYCDNCISSPDDKGCSCNYHWDGTNGKPEDAWEIEIPEGVENKDWRWVDKEKGSWLKLDEKGRPYPCCEYWYDEEGWETE